MGQGHDQGRFLAPHIYLTADGDALGDGKVVAFARLQLLVKGAVVDASGDVVDGHFDFF